MMDRLLVCLCMLAVSVAAPAAGGAEGQRPALISLIIDDIGYRLHNDGRAAALPGPVACAVLPHTPYAARMARLAHSLDKEVLVHLPMQADSDNHLLGPGALRSDMPAAEFTRTLTEGIESVPHAIGLSNHMGSLLTRDPGSMALLMRTLRPLGLFYLDSMTSHLSVASVKAERYQVPYLRRDVFLDNVREHDYILARFEQLIEIARENGSAVGIGHPYTITLDVLYDLLPRLKYHNVRLISLSEMLAHRTQRSESWQQSLSH